MSGREVVFGGLLMVWLLLQSLPACHESGMGEHSAPPTQGPARESFEGEAMDSKDIKTVQEEHTPHLMTLEGVLGTYIGQDDTGQPCIKVMVRERTPDLLARIPSTLEGYPVLVVESGEIRPLPGDSVP